MTGYMRTTWLEMKAPPPGKNVLRYVAASMSQLHTMCRLDRPNGWAHYIIWDEDRNLTIWRPKDLMFRIRNERFDDAIEYRRIDTTKGYPKRQHLISLLYDVASVGPLRFNVRGYDIIQRLLTGENDGAIPSSKAVR